ncbi:HU family DNA-binding protein [Oceanivirga salmonicida]|uniref:HU family DNA-binding protein n=1 Tax=Oceanivirga salmonicida TaxID=1769291 RepID=UPI0008369975|nr:HU family DNA-binding protein [Oceanivirga salmonicida]
MKKKEFIDLFAKKTNESKKKSEKYINLMLETLEESLLKENKVRFVGWGTFSKIVRKGREGINPLTGKHLVIPDKKVVKFTVGKRLEDKLNNK